MRFSVALSALLLSGCTWKCGEMVVEGTELTLIDLSEDPEKAYELDGDFLLSCGAGRGQFGSPSHVINVWEEGVGYEYLEPLLEFSLWPERRGHGESWAWSGTFNPSVWVQPDRVEEGAVLTFGDGIVLGRHQLLRIISYPYTLEDGDGNRSQGLLDYTWGLTEGTFEIVQINEITGCDQQFTEVRVQAEFDLAYGDPDGVYTTATGRTWFRMEGYPSDDRVWWCKE